MLGFLRGTPARNLYFRDTFVVQSILARPLLRNELLAMVLYLRRKARSARLLWGRQRLPGSIGATSQASNLIFLLSREPGFEVALPPDRSAVVLLYRVRGLDFRLEGGILSREADPARLHIRPDHAEWAARGLRLEGSRYHHGRAELHARLPRGGSLNFDVLALREDALHLLCWPCPKGFRERLAKGAVLKLSGVGSARVRLQVEGGAAVFPGCGGRIVRARVESGGGDVRQLLAGLPTKRDRRSE